MAADAVVTVKYSGELDESFVYDPKRPSLWQEKLRFTWSETKTARIGSDGVPVGGKSVINVAGTIKVTYAPPNTLKSCTGTFSLRTNTPDPITIGTDSVSALMPKSPDYVRSSSTVPPCDQVGVSGAPFVPPSDVAFGRAIVASCKVGQSPCTFSIDSTSPTNTSSLHATLTITKGTGSPVSRAADPKAAARADLVTALQRAAGPCLQLGMSLGVLASGAVWTSVAAPIPGGIPAGGAVIATGAVMANAVTPLCAELLKQIVVAYSIWKKDPPVSSAVVGLRLPSCARWQGALRSYCTQLSVAVTKLVAAERRVLPALKRLQTAAGQLGAARRKGDTAAITASQKLVDERVAALRAARAETRSAGKSVAGIITRAGVRGRVDAARSAAAAKVLLARLESLGVPSAQLPSAARAGLQARRPVDILAALQR